MSKLKLAAAALLGLGLVGPVAGCTVNRATGQPEFNVVSEAEEKELGAEADKEIVAQHGLVEDPVLQSYVDDVGARLVAKSEWADLDFTFRILDDPVVNAFALPGGYVYLTRGILAHFESEAAMAGVLGHEIGHVVARHGSRRITRQMTWGLPFALLGSLFGDTLSGIIGLAGVPTQLAMLKFSRDDERQSDELGVRYATKAGYDTAEMARFFRTLERMANGANALPSWASTHPDPGERYETVLELTRDAQAGGAEGGTYTVERDEYLLRIEGIVYGQNPRYGFVSGGEFRHPDLGIKFAIPASWKVSNGTSQVALMSPDEDALIAFTLSSEPSARGAANAFGENEAVTVKGEETVSVAGVQGVRLRSVADTDDGRVQLISTFIPWEGRVYVFHGLAPPEKFVDYEGTLVGVMDSFGQLTDPASLNIKPVVVKVVQADRSASFRELASRHPIPLLVAEEVGLEELALLNGVNLDDTIEQGRRFKVLGLGR